MRTQAVSGHQLKACQPDVPIERQFDYFLDSLARLVSFLPRFVGALLRPLQNGLVQFYALGMVLGLAVFLTVIVFRSVR